MAQLGSLIVTGTSRFLNSIYGFSATCSSDIVVGDTTNKIQIVGQTLDIVNTSTWDGSNPLLKSAIQSARSTVLQKYSPSNGVYNILTSGVASNTQDETTFTNKAYNLTYNSINGAFTIGSRKADTTSGSYSLSAGYNNTASGSGTSSLGYNCVSSGDYSFSCGYTCTASSSSTFAGGYMSTASGSDAFAFGGSCTSSGQFSVSFGNECTATNTSSYAEGYSCECNGSYSHAEGFGTKVTSNSSFSHAEGYYSETSHSYTHAEGYSGKAKGEASHAEGFRTEASGIASHSEGYDTVASGYYSHAQGYSNTANHRSQHVFGEYCVTDPSTASSADRGTYVEIVGNGDPSTSRSNARTLDWSGNEVLAGNLTLSGTTSDIVLSGTNNTWDGTNTSLKTAVTTLASRTYFGTCSTGASTNAKVVVCPEFTAAMADWPVGTTIKVHFTNGCTATAPTLNVNSKGAVNIYSYGTTIGLHPWRKGSIVTFTYDGTYWRMNDVNDFASEVQRSLLTSESADYFYPMIGNNHGSDPNYASLFTNGAFRIAFQTGTTTTEGAVRLDLGNNTAAGTDGNVTGKLRIYGNTNKYGTFIVGNLTANRTYTFPDKTGTVALTSDIPTTESSIKVKKNISAISNEEVNSILKLNAVKFDFKSCEENNAIHRGFIAEDVAKILPNLVTDEVLDDDGNLVDPARLNYMEMIPYLVEVCKRQQKEIDELKSLIRK